jgi:hypothetical protein
VEGPVEEATVAEEQAVVGTEGGVLVVAGKVVAEGVVGTAEEARVRERTEVGEEEPLEVAAAG